VQPAAGDNVQPSLTDQFAEHRDVLHATESGLVGTLEAVLELLDRAVHSGGKILFFGNGGSAADAQHLAAELVIRYKRDRRPIPAIALTTDTSVLTAGANDLGYEVVFARQIEALGRPGDVALGFTTSGRSKNVLLAFEVARRNGLATVAFSGAHISDIIGRCDFILNVPSTTTARIQEMHILLGHLLCDGLEQRQEG